MSVLIGITGGIAAGKSLVSSMLREKGAEVVCADEIAHRMLQAGSPALKALREAFGDGVFGADGGIDRKKLGAVVFASKLERKKLEAIVHPYILVEIERRIDELKRRGAKLIVLDAALLIESGLHKRVDQVWVVISSDQLDRLIRRDDLGEDAARARINAQQSDEFRLSFADVVIDNSRGIGLTRARVFELADLLMGGNAYG